MARSRRGARAPWILGTCPTCGALIHRPPRHEGIEVPMRSREHGTLSSVGPGDQGHRGGTGPWFPGAREIKAPVSSRSVRNIGSREREVTWPTSDHGFQYYRGDSCTRVKWEAWHVAPHVPGDRHRHGNLVYWDNGSPRGPEDTGEPAAPSRRVSSARGRLRAGQGGGIGLAESRFDRRPRRRPGHRAAERRGDTASLRDGVVKKKGNGD